METITQGPIRVLILGYGPMGVALTRGVLSCPDIAEIVGVFPWSYHPQESTSQREKSENAFRWFLKKYHIPLVQAKSVNHYQFTQILANIKPQLVFVGSWGEVIKPHILNTPDTLFVNCHPSYLPHHRGPNPYTAAILAGETETGVTFHVMDENIDTGDILLQAAMKIYPHDTGESLRERCSQLAESLIVTFLKRFKENQLQSIPQPPGGSYDKIPSDIEWIDWQAPPDAIERKIRAIYPWFENITQQHKTLITFSFGEIAKDFEFKKHLQAKPGTILKVTKQGVLVATIDPNQPILMKNPLFYDFPLILNPLLKALWLKPGDRFLNI